MTFGEIISDRLEDPDGKCQQQESQKQVSGVPGALNRKQVHAEKETLECTNGARHQQDFKCYSHSQLRYGVLIRKI